MEPDKDENNTSQGKRKADPTSYQRNIIKKSRVKGEPYKNYIPGRVLGPPCSCREKCFDKFTNQELQANLSRFYSLDTKDHQDIFLQGLIQISNVHRRRARVQVGNKPKSNTFKYSAWKGSAKIEVCLKAFFLNLQCNFKSS